MLTISPHPCVYCHYTTGHSLKKFTDNASDLLTPVSLQITVVIYVPA